MIPQRGFSLIEVLVALLVFAIGMLGIALHSNLGLQHRLGNEIHNNAQRVARLVIEPLNQALRQDKATFRQALQRLAEQAEAPAYFAHDNAVVAGFYIEIEAWDRDDRPLLNLASDQWRPPYTLSLNLNYAGADGVEANFVSSHVLVPPQ